MKTLYIIIPFVVGVIGAMDYGSFIRCVRENEGPNSGESRLQTLDITLFTT
jgi:hypothetical protein